MGTRSLINIKDEKGATIVTIYQQFDGYLSGVGVELKEFLSGKKLVNGYSGDTSKIFNGMGDLAALVIKEFKRGVGGLYIYPTGSENVGEDYVYNIYQMQEGLLHFSETSNIGIEVLGIYKGDVSGFDPIKLEQEDYDR